jgi:hypothetical protein
MSWPQNRTASELGQILYWHFLEDGRIRVTEKMGLVVVDESVSAGTWVNLLGIYRKIGA